MILRYFEKKSKNGYINIRWHCQFAIKLQNLCRIITHCFLLSMVSVYQKFIYPYDGNFICQTDYEAQISVKTLFLGVSLRVFLQEISI